MGLNWLRTCTLTVAGTTVQGGKSDDLRVIFSVDMWSIQAPNMGHFRVYNPSQKLADGLKGKEGSKVTFSAGYGSDSGQIFSGDLKQFISGHETPTDTYVDIFAADTQQGYDKARVTKTLPAGYTPMDKLKAATDAMGPFGAKLGLVNVDLSKPKYPRALPLIGMAKEIIRDVALSARANWSTQMGEVRLIDFTKKVDTGVIDMGPATGLVGWPQQTSEGIVVNSLLNSKLQPHMKLKIDPSLIQQAEGDNNPFSQSGPGTNEWLNKQNVSAGVYVIFKLNRRGDTRGGDWMDTSTCVGEGGQVPQSQIDLGYY